MATRGLTKSLTFADSLTLKGHLIANGSRGVWPLMLENGVWKSKPAPTSAPYLALNGPDLPEQFLTLSAVSIGESFIAGDSHEADELLSLLASAQARSYSTEITDNPDVDTSLELTDANALICTFSGREYRKTNAGLCIAAYFYHDAGYWGPMLVSETSSAVSYTTSGRAFNALGTVSYGGKTWYYSNTEYFMGGNPTDTSGTGRVKLNNGAMLSVSNAALALLDLYFL